MTRKLPLVLAAILCATIGAARAQDSTERDWIRDPAMGNYKAYAEFKMGNYAAARHVWDVLAGLGNADALFNLGILAEDGLGEPRDPRKAEALYVAAANAGGVNAQYRLGLLYASGGVVAKDTAKARHYLGLASAGGDKDAATRLESLDRPQSPLDDFEQAEMLSSSGKNAEAVALYQRAAEAGNLRARTRLAWMYEAGRGVKRDLAEAARLFMSAAEDGDAEAQYAIAVMYRTGKGLPQDREQSLIWLERAAAQGYPAAKAALAAEQGAAR
jgi:hypothetical protein